MAAPALRRYQLLNRLPLRVSFCYFAITLGWIALSDSLLPLLSRDPQTLAYLSFMKGTLFVLVTTVLLYVLLRRASIAMRESEAKYLRLYENLRDALVRVDLDGRIQECNDAYVEMTGYERSELIGMSYVQLTPPKWHAFEQAITETQLLVRGYSDIYEKEYVRKDGTIIPVNLCTFMLRTSSGAPHALWAIARDITHQKEVEEALRGSLREKELLLRELYHRTKNNMQLVCSLFSLETSYERDPRVAGVFHDMESRIHAMALVHEKLYQSGSLSNICLEGYIRDLAGLLAQSYKVSSRQVALDLALEKVSVGVEAAIPCGLVLNELISNAMKHAFPDGRQGRILVTLRRLPGNKVELSVSDDGVGLPAGFSQKSDGRLGLNSLVMVVQHQLGGSLELESSAGVTWRIQLDENALNPAAEELRTAPSAVLGTAG